MLIERSCQKGQRPVVGQVTLAPRASYIVCVSPGVKAVMWLVISMVSEEYGANKLRVVVTVGLM